jgi:type IV pilus assembly protein PilB
VVAQRLVKKLCESCKEVGGISDEERKLLEPYTDTVPSEVAHPVGCQRCKGSGYYGRAGIFEVVDFDPRICQMIRDNVSVAEIRSCLGTRERGLISSHGIQKITELVVAPADVYEQVLSHEVGDSEALQSQEIA